MSRLSKRDTPSRIRLTDCTNCRKPFVVPVEFHEVGDDHWHMTLRCGACGDVRETMVTQAEADWFDRDLAVYERSLHDFAMRFARDRFESDIDVFVKALNADAILPEDFGL